MAAEDDTQQDWMTALGSVTGLTPQERAEAEVLILSRPAADRPVYVRGTADQVLLRIRALLAHLGAALAQAAGTGAGPSGREQQQKLPWGSVVALQEMRADSSRKTCGTATIISSKGLAVTARHCVVWEDGYIHPRRLCIKGHHDIEICHVRSFPQLDITVLQLKRIDAPSGGDSSGTITSSGSSSVATMGTGSTGVTQWPCLEPTTDQPIDVPVVLYGYPAIAEEEGLLRSRQPLAVHGKVSHFTKPRLVGVADYQAFPNMSGGLVVWDGQYLGTHTCAVTSSPKTHEPPSGSMPAVEADEIVDMDESPVTSSGPNPASASTALTLSTEQRLTVCEAGLQLLQVAGGCTAKLGLFVPCATILAQLQACGLLTPDIEELELQGAAKRARYKP